MSALSNGSVVNFSANVVTALFVVTIIRVALEEAGAALER